MKSRHIEQHDITCLLPDQHDHDRPDGRLAVRQESPVGIDISQKTVDRRIDKHPDIGGCH